MSSEFEIEGAASTLAGPLENLDGYGEDFELELEVEGVEGAGEDMEIELDAYGEGMESDEFGMEFDEAGVVVAADPLADYQIIGADTRKRVTNTRVVPWQYICKLDPPGCTGALIAPNKVLTAAHCVYDRGTRKTQKRIRVIPGKNGGGRGAAAEPFGSALASRLQFPSAYATAPTYGAAWAHDYAVITIKGRFRNNPGFFSNIRVIPAAQLARLQLNTAGYPGDKGGETMWRTYNRVVSVNGPRIEYLHDTFGGQSGSPVWLLQRGERSIVAVHVARDDAGTPGASPVVANRGVAMTPTVLADVRRWMRS